MNKHLKYLWYVIRHKWFVFVECCKLGIPWRGITHDLSKFRWSEWKPYVDYFYGKWGVRFNGGMAWEWTKNTKVKNAFDHAWLLHQHRNPHHWQHWLLREDDGGTKIIRMPFGVLKEMIADWRGAGKAITGKDDVVGWYRKNRDKIVLHDLDRQVVEDYLGFPPLERETKQWD
jgi:Family of unknown function (DUF5662)